MSGILSCASRAFGALLWLSASALAASPCDEAAAAFRLVARDASAAEAARAAFETERGALPSPAWAAGYCRAVADNLARKMASAREGVRFDADLLIRTAIRYEAFRVATFRAAGVAPKLFFGFLDAKGATAAYERKLLEVAAKVAPLLNEYARERGLSIRVSAKEIAITQLAEGGALLLTDRFGKVDAVHPVYGVGLDDYRIGFVRFPGLIERVDKAFGSRLATLNGARDDSMSFVESVLGTAIMWLYEKDLAEQKLRAEGRPSLAGLAADEQFVIASLVYNSGILFSQERIAQMLRFDTGDYLADISARSAPKRALLPVMTSAAADEWLTLGKAIPDQPTSWNAVYHVMQRYGAWIAVARYTKAFTAQGDVAAP